MSQKVQILIKDKWWLIIVGLLIGLGVAFPWLGGGRLLLLDWPVGPHQPVLTPQAYGLQGGLITGLVVQIVLYPIFHLLGDYATTFIIIAIFPVAAVAIGSLVGGSLWTKIPAAIFYCVNPFVYDRIYAGQLSLIFGYAILPFAVKSLLAQPEPSRTRWVKTGLWWIALITCAPHFVWIFGVVFGVFVLLSIRSPKVLLRLLFSAVFAGIGISYELISGLSGGIGIHVGSRAFAAYQTRGGPGIGLFSNVLGLYGFWRQGPLLAKQAITGWPIFLAGIILVAAFGMFSHYRSGNPNSDNNKKVTVLVASGIAGMFLAMGDQGPIGSFFKFAYDYIPFFKIMREPQKFSILWALALATGFGWGTGELYKKAFGKAAKIFTALVAIGLCLVYEPLMFNGFDGQLKTTKFPSSWYKANKIIGKGQGSILALPWHLYLSYPFTSSVIANPSPSFFSRPTISGDNEQLPGLPSSSTLRRSAFLQYVYNYGPDIGTFGSIVAPLGVKYIVLEKTVDWRNYSWLNNQQDLKKIFNSSSIEVFQNQNYQGLGTASSKITTVPNWGSILALAQLGKLKGQVLQVQNPGPGPMVLPQGTSRIPPASPVKVKRSFAAKYYIDSHQPGWIQLSLLYDPGWTLQGRPAIQLAEGNLGWSNNGKASVVFFSPVDLIFVGYGVSFFTVFFGIIYLILDKYQLKKEELLVEG